MTITVRYQAQLRQAAGVASESVSLPKGATVLDLLRTLAEQRPALTAHLLGNTGGKRPSLLVFADDHQVEATQSLNGIVEVILMTPIAGGLF